jgi:hypothetical protein
LRSPLKAVVLFFGIVGRVARCKGTRFGWIAVRATLRAAGNACGYRLTTYFLGCRSIFE